MNTVALASVTQINPKGAKRGELKPDDLVDFAPMAALHEDGHMRVTEQRPYSEVSTGFIPFLDGDLLVAKITPCFENNKIGLASISTKQGFGSTEFHVIRCDEARIYNRYLFFCFVTNTFEKQVKEK